MRQSSDYRCGTQPGPVRTEEHNLQALQARVSAEFREMPGMRLTLAQASRLFSIDTARCERVLGYLVDVGVLATNGGAFAKAGTGTRCA